MQKSMRNHWGTSFFATRYDYLRIAVSMLNEWQQDTCVGQYLKLSTVLFLKWFQGDRGRVFARWWFFPHWLQRNEK